MTKDEVLLRIDCGAETEFVDPQGNVWLADTADSNTSDWHPTGGISWNREPQLTIHAGALSELYRTERCGLEGYRFQVDEGTYALRLHFAETFESNYRSGMRSLSVAINGRSALEAFDPYREAGGFARPAVMEVRGIKPDTGVVEMTFGDTQGSMVQAVELLRTTRDEWSVTKLTSPASGALPENYEDRPAAKAAKSVLFVGNSHTIFWAIPETIEKLINTYTDMKLRCHRLVQGGKGIAWHATEGKLRETLRDNRYDMVVLQGVYGDEGKAVVQELAGPLQAAGTRVLIYSTWSRRQTPDSDLEQWLSHTEGIAQETGTEVVRVGRAWQTAMKRQPELVLHGKDGLHSGMFGAYLTTRVFFGFLAQRRLLPKQDATILVGQAPVPLEEAEFLEEIAWETVASQQHSSEGR